MNRENFAEPIFPPRQWALPALRAPGLPERERFPCDPERRQRSAAALRALRQEHPDLVAGRPFPWRSKLLPTTGLPATLRTWADAAFDLDDETGQAFAQRWLAGGLRSAAVFGEDLGQQFAEDFRATPVIKVRTTPAELAGPTMRHFAWRQTHRGLPVLGGSVRVHEVTSDRRICITSSYFPVADDPPDLEAHTTPIDREWTALLAVLANAAVDPLPLLATAVARFFQEQRHREAADFLRFWAELGERGILGSDEVAWRLAEAVDAWRLPEAVGAWPAFGEGHDAAVAALEGLRTWLDERVAAGRLETQVAPLHGSDLAILPFAGAYLLVQRIAVAADRLRPWYVDIHVHSGAVLGAPWQPVVHAPAYVASSGEALLGGQPSGNAAGLDVTKLEQFITLNDGNDVDLSQPLPPNLDVATATVAVFAQHLLQYLTESGGVILPVPQPKVFVAVNSAERTGFTHPAAGKTVWFQRDAGNLQEDGKSVQHPGRDPEVVMHEFTHAFLNLLNDDPWDTPATLAPFSQALHEGYAMYLARSLAVARGDDADQPWGRGAYQPQHWGNRWQLNRANQVVGADLLPAPNVYPTGEYSTARTLQDYDVGMVWARALWDVRTVVEPPAADRLAVQAYPYLHGYLTSFELAAEALINADAQVSELDLGSGTQPLWAARGIAAGQGVFGFAQADNGVLLAAGDAGILRSTDAGATWTLESANLAGGATLTGAVAVAADGDHLYAIAELPPPTATGTNSQWNPGVYWRNLGQANSSWQELAGWPDAITPLCLLRVGPGQMLVGSNRGVYALRRDQANQHSWTPPQDASFAALALATVAQEGLTVVQAADPARLYRSPLVDGAPTSASWQPTDKLFDNDNQARVTALVGRGAAVVAGVVPPPSQANPRALWQLNQDWSAKTPLGNLSAAVLALTADAATLWAATASDVLAWDGAVFHAHGLPAPWALVLSLGVTATHLLAGTLMHGIWRLPRNGGSWQPAWTPVAPTSILLPAGGRALFSFVLAAAQPAFALTTANTVSVDAVYQVGFPPTRVAPHGNGATYNLRQGAVVAVVRNLTNNLRALQCQWVAPDHLSLL